MNGGRGDFVLDASVYVARHSPRERHHERAKELWSLAPKAPFHVPEIFSLEIVAAFARLQFDAEMIDAHQAFTTGMKFVVHPVDRGLVEAASVVARDARLRAADSLYVALALRLDATLLTLDAKLAAQLAASPSAALRELSIES